MHLIVNCLKNGIEIIVGQAVFKFWSKTIEMLFESITQESLNFDDIFEFLGQFPLRCIYYFSKKGLIILR